MKSPMQVNINNFLLCWAAIKEPTVKRRCCLINPRVASIIVSNHLYDNQKDASDKHKHSLQNHIPAAGGPKDNRLYMTTKRQLLSQTSQKVHNL
jgi:hypothetical protein